MNEQKSNMKQQQLNETAKFKRFMSKRIILNAKIHGIICTNTPEASLLEMSDVR